MNVCLRFIQNFVVPPACLICRRRLQGSDALCRTCLGQMPRIDPACPRCGLATPRPGPCGRCVVKPPLHDAVVAGSVYAPPVDRMVSMLKFRHRLELAPALAQLVVRALGPDRPMPQCLIPVPLHAARLRRRGFNQALEIARPVARTLGLPLRTGLVVRRRATERQSDLPLDERRRNVRRAFEVDDDLPYRHVAIVDDVMTSGETAAAVATRLRRAGVERIEVWVAARVA